MPKISSSLALRLQFSDPAVSVYDETNTQVVFAKYTMWQKSFQHNNQVIRHRFILGELIAT
jgi:hypothetical protein